MSPACVLVVAKAPVEGQAKTRLATNIGHEGAAEVAAAALLDTLDAATATGWPVVTAMSGDVRSAARAAAISAACSRTHLVAQRGRTFAERLVGAHADAAAATGLPVVQIGMDTPQVSADDLAAVAAALAGADAVLGHAEDGGWWVLGLHDPRRARVLVDVAMSEPTTGARTEQALVDGGARVRLTRTLRDLDTWADARAVADAAPGSRTAAVVAALAAVGRDAAPGVDAAARRTGSSGT